MTPYELINLIISGAGVAITALAFVANQLKAKAERHVARDRGNSVGPLGPSDLPDTREQKR